MAGTARNKTKYPGVFYRLAKRPNGKGEEKIYYVVFKRQGKVVETKVGGEIRDDMTPARAAKLRADMVEGVRQTAQEKRVAEANTPTVSRLWELYRDTLTNTRSIATDTSNFKHLEPFHKSIPAQITTADVDAFRAKLLKSLSPQTVKHVLTLLRRILKFGVRADLVDYPPRLLISMPSLDNQKTENLTPEQIERLLYALDTDYEQNMCLMMKLALCTGIRRGALFGLRWKDLDFERGFINLDGASAKKRKSESIPMNASATAILVRTKELADAVGPPSEYVFPGRDGGKRTGCPAFFKRIREAAGLPDDFRPLHGLRHVFASLLASSGQVDLLTLQKLLTHESPQMTLRYSHLADEALRKASGVVDGIFDGK